MAAALIGACASLCMGGVADAQGLSVVGASSVGLPLPSVSAAVPSIGLSLPSVGITVPSVGVTVPSVGVTVPSLGVTVPSLGVTVPSVGVTVPSVGVTLPGVNVQTPEVGVSTPSVTVSTPEVSASTPSSPEKAPTEGSSPTSPESGQGGSSGGGSSGGSSGGGAGGGSGSGGSGSGGSGSGGGGQSPLLGSGATIATAASVSDPSQGQGSSAASPDAGLHGSSAGPTGKSPSRGTSRASSRKATRTRGHNSGSGGFATAATALGLAAPSALHVSRSARSVGHTSNPLDTIGGHIPLPLPVPDWSKPIIVLLLLLVIGFATRSRMARRRARRLEGQRATLLRDVDAMQAALVPEVPARVGGLSVSVAYRPADGPAAGGDFFDVFVPERGKIAIILGDVVGHGHGALTHAALTRYTLRAYLQTGMEPRAALALAGRVLADRGMENFATVALAVYHAREGRLVFASAGHPPPILQGLQTREPLTMCASPPIGWNVPTGRRQTTVSLPPGAVACFFTDGLIEARCKERRLLGRRRLGEILAGLGSRPDAEKLLAKVQATALSTPDDMAACIVAPEMTVVPVRTHVEELEADAQELDRGDVRRFLETCQVLSPAIDRAVDLAGDVVAVFGTAVLRVELLSSGATVAVSPPHPIAGTDASRPGSAQPVGDPAGAG
jgi:serine phosphatase RsbU (regulator of sigma subunit)